MGCVLCCCRRKTTDLPQKYVENRSCTDIIFGIVFVVFIVLYLVLGAFGFKRGDLKGILRGSDYLGYRCGEGDAPNGFAAAIPTDAPFQSQEWSENKYLWYPVSLEKGLTSLLDVRKYLSLGVCVKTCPKVNVKGLSDLINKRTQAGDLKTMQIYSYGSVGKDGAKVDAASVMYTLYDTSLVDTRCFPSAKQPPEVLAEISSPTIGKLFDFFGQGIEEIQESWRVFIIAMATATVLGFLFVLLIRFFISLIVWLILVLVFFLLAGIGGICFLLYYTKGETIYFKIAGVGSYSTLFLVLSIIFFVAALIYLFIIIAVAKKVRFVCAVIKVSCRVMGSAPTVLLVPLVTSVFMIIVCIWAFLLAISIYNIKEEGISFSLIHDTDALKYTTAPSVMINNTMFFNVTTRVLESPNAFWYMTLANLFAFLWTMGFLGAFSFTVIAFVAVFWYFSDLRDEGKAVPVCGVCKAVFWTLIYHTGTLAIGSLLVAIIQFFRILLSYFAKKAREVSGNNGLLMCIVCYAKCFLAYFERVLETINKNAYIMMCITGEGFCFSACRTVSLILSHAVELLFLSWFVDVIIFIGKLFIVCSCCVISYFLLDIKSLSPNVEVKVLPLVFIGVMAYLLSSIFFNVYSSTASALLVCYCYDREINESLGVYYVPEELENQINDYSQKEKVAQLNERQAAVHTK